LTTAGLNNRAPNAHVQPPWRVIRIVSGDRASAARQMTALLA
jgi:hypothetical protein